MRDARRLAILFVVLAGAAGCGGSNGDGPGEPDAGDNDDAGADAGYDAGDDAGAAAGPQFVWHTFYGGEGWDIASAIAVGPGGDLYIAGVSDDEWEGPDGEPPLHGFEGGYDEWILRLKSDGSYVWHTFIGGAGDDWPYGLAVDAEGAVYGVEKSAEIWYGPSGEAPLWSHSTGGAFDSEVGLFKLDADGAYEWHSFAGAHGSDFGTGIALDGAGGAVVTGSSEEIWYGPGGEPPIVSPASGAGCYALSIGEDGAYRWHTYFGECYGAYDTAPLIGPTGDLLMAFIAGDSWSGPEGEAPLHPFSGGYDALLVGATTEGAYLWHTYFGSPDWEYYYGFARGASDDLFMTGYGSVANWYGPSGEGPLNPCTSVYSSDLFVLATSVTGEYLWHTCYGSGGKDEGFGVAARPGGGVIVSGVSGQGWSGPGGEAPIHPYSGGEDMLLLALEADGSYAWHGYFGTDLDESVAGIAADGAGGFAFVSSAGKAWNGPSGEPPLHAYTIGWDAVIVKLAE